LNAIIIDPLVALFLVMLITALEAKPFLHFYPVPGCAICDLCNNLDLLRNTATIKGVDLHG
jgi:hypothetical protein